jgi:hypothetical protein
MYVWISTSVFDYVYNSIVGVYLSRMYTDS